MPPRHADPLLAAAGTTECLLGNEAIARGALEAGVAFACGYPGTPSSEITDSFARVADRAGIRFEYSVNEKIAVEMAFAASLAGARSLCAMKHLGLMYAGDPLSTIPYIGIRAGMVIVSAGDPSCRTSPNEQDQRWLGPMLHVPVLDPSTPAQAHAMARFAFELSEQTQLPVLLRPTTRVCHTRQVVELGPLRQPRATGFVREPHRLVPVPVNARRLRIEIEGRLERAEKMLSESPFLCSSGTGKFAVVSSGSPAALCADLLSDKQFQGRLRLVEIGAVWPLCEQKILELLAGCRRILVVEELSPFLEDHLHALFSRSGINTEIFGKRSGHFPVPFEYTPDQITTAIHEAFGFGRPAPERPAPEPLPARPPSLCPGCPHRAAQFALRQVFGPESLYFNDIGCYTLGYGPPLRTADALLCMGAGFTLAAGVAAVTGKRTVGILGDSTFFHSGLPALVDAVKQDANVVAIVLDNQVTAMTGFQESPTVEREGKRLRRRISPAEVVRALGVKQVEKVDPYDLGQAVRALERAKAAEGVSVVIFERPCPVFQARQLHVPYRKATYRVDSSRCGRCSLYPESGCARKPSEPRQQRLFLGRIARGRPAERAPCSEACPLGICAQGLAADALAGPTPEALGELCTRLVLPETICRVCDRPCEKACVLSPQGRPIAVNDIKRYLLERARHDGGLPPARPGKDCGLRAAVVGAGPAGLAAAFELRRRGWRVELYDASEKPGGLLRYGIPPYRLPREALDRDIERILSMGVTFRPSARLGRDIRLEELERRFDGVVVAIGGGPGGGLQVPVRKGAREPVSALEYLRRFNMGEEMPRAGHVVVVGGGNAAVDAARTARRLGARATIAYRRDREDMPAFGEEIAAAEAEGVEILYRVAPVAVAPEGLEVVDTRPAEPDSTGRRKPVPVEGSNRVLPCDLVLSAIGQSAEGGTTGLDCLAGGLVAVDERTGKASGRRVYAAGDITPGARTVARAMASGRRAAACLEADARGVEPPV
ncbi:MAG: hypothetical protein D6806_12985, partial [Deltaproteobacteria bacterium]